MNFNQIFECKNYKLFALQRIFKAWKKFGVDDNPRKNRGTKLLSVRTNLMPCIC